MKALKSLVAVFWLFLCVVIVTSWKLQRSRLIIPRDKTQLVQKEVSSVMPRSIVLSFKTAEADDSVYEDQQGGKPLFEKQRDQMVFLKRLSNGVIPLAASVGFAVTPSTKALLRVAGAAAGGVAGLIARKAIDLQIENLKKNSLLELDFGSTDADDGFFDPPEDESRKMDYIGPGSGYDDGTGDDSTTNDRLLTFPQRIAPLPSKSLDKDSMNAKKYPGWEYTDSGRLRENDLIPEAVALAVGRTFTKYKALHEFELKQLEVIARGCKVQPKDLSLYFTLVLTEYLFQYTETESMYLLDFQRLFDFIKKIDFSFDEIADAIALAANNVGKCLEKDEQGFFTEAFPVRYFMQATKLFYASDKLIGNFQGYYGQRAKTALSYFPDDEYKKMITQACQQLMIDLLNEIVESPYSYSPAQFENYRFLLTTSPEASDFTLQALDELLAEMFKELVNDRLQLNTKKDRTIFTVTLPSLDEITHMSDLFQWNYTRIQKVFEPMTSTFYRKVVHDILSKVTADASLGHKYEGVLEERMQSLHIPFSLARTIVKEEVESINDQAINNIMAAFNRSGENIDLTYQQIISYAISMEEISRLTKGIFPEVTPLSITRFPLSQDDLIYVFTQASLQKDLLLESGKLSEETLGKMLNVPKTVVEQVYRLLVIPQIASFINQCIAEKNYSPEAFQAIRRQWKAKKLPKQEFARVKLAIYYEQVEEVANSPGQIPTPEAIQNLQQIAQFMNLSTAVVNYVHVAVFGDKYLQAIEECMSTTGVVTPEYMDNLARLRQAYQLSESDAANLFSIAIANRVRPSLYAVYDLFKSITDPNYDPAKAEARRKKLEEKKAGKGKDTLVKKSSEDGLGEDDEEEEEGSGFVSKYSLPPELLEKRRAGKMYAKRNVKEDVAFNVAFLQRKPGTEAQRSTFMKEVLNLVETVQENYQLQPFDPSIAVENYPIRATGMANASELIDMYRFFLVSKLLEPNPAMKERYDSIDAAFGTLLGLPWWNRNEQKQMLLQDIYVATLQNLLEEKDLIEAKDIEQFYRLADEFNVTDPQLRKDVYEFTVKRGLEAYTKTFIAMKEDDSPEAKLNPAQARRFRKQIESLGYKFIDYYGDRPLDFFYNYYSYEAKYLIDEGQLEELAELPEIYDFPEEVAVSIIQTLSRRMVDEYLNLALRASKQFEEKQAVGWMGEVLRYFQFIAEEGEEETGSSSSEEGGGSRAHRERKRLGVGKEAVLREAGQKYFVQPGEVPINGRLFDEMELNRLLQFYSTHLEGLKIQVAQMEQSELTQQALAKLNDQTDLLGKLKSKIVLSPDYYPPARGMLGLLGKYKTREEIEREQSQKVLNSAKNSKQLRDFS